MAILDIYRRDANGSFSWFASSYSVRMARAIIKSSDSSPTEEYLICDSLTKEKISLRPDGCWLPSKESSEFGSGKLGLFGARSADTSAERPKREAVLRRR